MTRSRKYAPQRDCLYETAKRHLSELHPASAQDESRLDRGNLPASDRGLDVGQKRASGHVSAVSNFTDLTSRLPCLTRKETYTTG